MQQRGEDSHAFPLCSAARTVADACTGLADDLWDSGSLPSVYLLVDGRLRCLAARGYFQVVDGFPPGTGVIGRVVASGVGEVLNDVHLDPDFIAAVPGLRAEASMPVRVAGVVIGSVNLESTTTVDDAGVEALMAAATVLGERIERLGGLPPVPLAQRVARISVGLASSNDATVIRTKAVEGAVELSGMSSAALSGVDADGRWAVRHSSGPLGTTLAGWTDADHRVIARWVGTGTSSHFPGGDHTPPGYEFLLHSGVRAIAVQPLVVGGQVTGLLTTADTDPVAHDPMVGAALELLAAQTAASLATATAIAELSRRAAQDPLTGLSNAAVFAEDLQRHAGTPGWACVLMDLDHFKVVNDTFGHPAGDRLLRALAAELTAEVREGDSLYRLGGDEFAALVRADDADVALAVAERLVHAARRVRTTISAEVALLAAPGADADSVRGGADAALYRAKAAGRDQVVAQWFSPGTCSVEGLVGA